MILWAIDPGKHECAVALFAKHELLWTGYLTPSTPFTVALPDRIVIEQMRIYPGAPRTDVNDLIDVTATGHELIGAVRAYRPNLKVTRVSASDWKGQLPKPIHHRRVWDALSAVERMRFSKPGHPDRFEDAVAIEARILTACDTIARTGRVRGYSAKVHNLLDAVGLGLFALGRLGRGGTPRASRHAIF